MPQQFSNNARSTLANTISDTATSLTVQAGAADLFPTANVGSGSVPSTNNWFKATLQDVSGNVEIIYVRTRNGGSAVFSNILRAQEGTTARTFVAGTVVGLRVTAADIQASINIPGADNTFTGDNTFDQPIVGDLTGDVTGNVTGNVTGDLTGNVTGNVTGNLTGDVTGDVTGNVTGNTSGTAGSVATTDWTITQSGSSIVFSYQGTAKLALTSAGAVTAVDNITAYGTV
jgi:hypothetical protein